MHLKSLDIQGFKSFPEKTSITFPDGITAIVGPNGSGKSNISDAIRWVLGEQSGKQLRSSKMEDVIFTGTTKRRPQGYAQVGLTIDNSDHALPVEYSEVTVSRRYYRSGESEYYINNQQVRLKDVNELFLDTGLGKDGYSIIGQGKIAEILSPKSEDRRAIIEEVAGISKYRYRKNEAMRKLQATEENLVRLYDILGELTDRLPALESQSKKAKQYLEYRDEKTVLDISLWMDEIERIKRDSETYRDAFDVVKGQLDDITLEIGNIEKDIGVSFEDNRQINVTLEQLRAREAEAEEKVAEMQSAIAVLENRMEYIRGDIERSQTELGDIERRRTETEEAIRAQRETVARKRDAVAEGEKELSDLYAQMEKLADLDSEKREKSESIRAEIETLRAQSNEMQMEKISAETQVGGLSSRESEVREALAEREPLVSATQREIDEIREKQTACDDKITELCNMESGIEKLLSLREKAFETLENEKNEALALLKKLQDRRDLLSEMERQLEGYQGSVRIILKQAESGQLSGICGTVSQLIKVPKEYIIAVETALGAAIQNVVAKTQNDAKKALFLLKNRNGGRATVLPLDTLKVNRIDGKEFKNAGGYLGVAADLVQTEYKTAVDFLLGRTLVVETLDDATRLADRCGRKYKIVTLDGQVVNVGGSLTGGSVARSAGLLSRGLEIEKLEKEILAASAAADGKSAAALKAKEEFAEISARMEGLEAEKQTAAEQKETLEHLAENKNVILESHRTVLQNLNAELEQIAAARTLHEGHIEEVTARIDAVRKKTEALEADLIGIESLSEQNRREAETLKERVAAGQVRQAEIFKEIEGVENVILQYEAQLGRISEDSGQRLAAIEENRKQLETLSAEKENAGQALEDTKKGIVTFKTQGEELIAKRLVNDRRQTELRSSQKEKLDVKEKLLGESARLENKLTNILDHSETLIAKLMDEYDLTISEAEQKRVVLEDPAASRKRAAELRQKMRALGNVNVDAIEEYAEVKKRHDFLQGQVDDLTTSKKDLEKLITELLGQMTTIFTESFKLLNIEFNRIFGELFGGGRAELILTDPEDVLGCNIEIRVAPPGKIIKSILSLSGGEQAFSAIALYFAILKIRPTPFCIMDEIEAALDDVNVAKFASYLRRYCGKTQFVTITHRRGTMEEADVLYGVTMQEKGVSQLLTINVGEMEKQLKLK